MEPKRSLSAFRDNYYSIVGQTKSSNFGEKQADLVHIMRLKDVKLIQQGEKDE